MKLNFFKQILSVAVLTVAFSGFANAQSGTVVFVDDGAGTSTGALLTNLGTNVDGSTVATEVAGLSLTVESLTTNGTPGIVTAVGTRFGVGDNFFRAGTPDDEITFSFDQAVTIDEISFSSVSGSDDFLFNGQLFGESANGVTIENTAFSLAADQPFTISANTGNIGLVNLDVTVVDGGAANVPEPSSATLLGLLSLGVVARRRRR